MFAYNVAIIWLQRYGSMVIRLYGVMSFGAKKESGWSEWVIPVREGIPEKKNLLLGIAEIGVGNPLAKLILTLF